MKGKYKRENGQVVEIAEHDTINKSVMVTINGRGCEWYPESEVEKWKSLEPKTELAAESEIIVITEDEVSCTPTEEIKAEKPKRGRKKKS